MAVHGKVRTEIIRALGNRAPFTRRTGGNAMSAITGATSEQGRMPAGEWRTYRDYADAGKIAYTVMSYATVIGYVLIDDTKIVPDVSYSQTTAGHQSLCRAYL